MRELREFSAGEENVLRETQAVLCKKGRGILAPVLPLYMGVTRRYQESWLTDKLDAFVAVHELSLGQALVEI